MKGLEADGSVDGRDVKVTVVVSDFNRDITDGLLMGATEVLKRAGCDDVTVVRAPGAFELPVIAAAAATTCDAVVALGAVIEGETDHYHHIATQASAGLMQAALQTGVPMGFGILTVTDPAHAAARSGPGPGNKGAEAAEAALRAVMAIRSLQ